MSDPIDHFVDTVGFRARRQLRSVDHQDRQVQIAGGVKFRARAISARVFRHDQINAVMLQKCAIRVAIKRPARDQNVVVWKRRRNVGRIHKTQDIVMLRRDIEGGDFGSPDGKENAFPRGIKGLSGAVDVCRVGPEVIFAGQPGGTGQGDQRYLGISACHNGIAAHLSGKGMGGINQMRNFFFGKVGGKTIGAAIAANAGRDRLAVGACDAACIGKRRRHAKPCNTRGQGAGFGGATKDQEVRVHV